MHKKLEPGRNVMYVCSQCTYTKKEIIQKDIKEVLKDNSITHVKKAFKSEESELAEYMWVKIKGIDWKKETVYGTLDNVPINITTISLNDAVEVNFDEIVELYPFVN